MSWLPIVDAHCDTLGRLEEENRSLTGRSDRGHSDLPRLLAAGVSLQVLAICTETDDCRERGLRYILERIERFDRELSGRADGFPILSKGDLDRLGPDRVGFLLGLEGAGSLCGKPDLLRILFRLGVRLVGVTWNVRNDFADGAMVEGGGGLTGAGRALLAVAQEIGMVLDLAHLNERGFWDVLAAARRPVVVSHANAKAICDHPRNLNDAQLKALADQGGVVGLNLCPRFLTRQPKATSEDALRHLEHLLSTAGPRAVGFGFDYDGISELPSDLPDITALPALLAGLDRLGLSAQERADLLGGNWLRLLRQILPENQG